MSLSQLWNDNIESTGLFSSFEPCHSECEGITAPGTTDGFRANIAFDIAAMQWRYGIIEAHKQLSLMTVTVIIIIIITEWVRGTRPHRVW